MSLVTDRTDPGLRTIKPNGQQASYLVLSESERQKGFVRPVRTSYKHLKCGATTQMAMELAETYAAKPDFYTGTFCSTCRSHFNLLDEFGEPAFVWCSDNTPVGS